MSLPPFPAFPGTFCPSRITEKDNPLSTQLCVLYMPAMHFQPKWVQFFFSHMETIYVDLLRLPFRNEVDGRLSELTRALY